MPPRDLNILYDCRHYKGDRPCAQNRLCDGCGRYQPYQGRILIIKIGALGDVIRTLCLLPELRRRHPSSQINWLTSPAAAAFITGHPQIDRVIPFEPFTAQALIHEQFHTLISLDKESGPCGLAMSIPAAAKLGFGLSEVGTPIPLNADAVPLFQLGLSDDLKFRRNTRGYPQLVHEALGFQYTGQRYELPVAPAAVDAVRARLSQQGWNPDRPTLGVNVGAGKVFANKMWTPQRTAQMLSELHRRHSDWQVMLVGGMEEKTTLDQLHAELPWTIHTRADNSAPHLVAIIDQLDLLFSGDTLTMHLAIARRRGSVAFFGPTCQQEIDLFGLGEKLVASIPCSPCYKHVCDRADACLSAVSIESALSAIERVMHQRLKSAGRISAPEIRRAG